jgi:hypothetical protein
MIIFASDKRLGLDDVGQRRLQGNTPVAREGEASSVVVPTIGRTSFRGLSIALVMFSERTTCEAPILLRFSPDF